MSLQNFISEVKTRGLARNNRYEVTIPRFPVLSGNGRLLTIFCDAVNLPGMNFAATPHRFYGEAWEMPYERMFDPVTLSFYVDSDMELKVGFDRWMEQVVNPNTRELNYYKNYVQDIEIKVVNVDGKSPYGLTLYEAYPRTINSIQLDAAGRDVMKMTVTMQYRYWKPFGKITQAIPTQSNPFEGFKADPRGSVTGSGIDFNIDSDQYYT